MLSYLLRLFIIFIPANIFEILIMARCFYRNKPIWPLILVWSVRILFVLPLYLPPEMVDAQLLRTCVLAELFMTPIQNVIFVWTFHNDRTSVAKVLAIGLICEGIGSVSMSIATIVINLIGGHNFTVSSFAFPFKFTDLLSPIIVGMIYLLITRKGKSVLNLIYHYEIKHPIIVTCILLPVYVIGYLTSLNPLSLNGVLFYNVTTSMIAIISISLGTYMYAINSQRKALRASSRMVNDHYQMLQSRIDELERQQNEINAKMAVLVSANFPEDLTTRYLNDMKHLKENLYTTLYTHYYMIDAVLSAKAKYYREHQIDFKCQCEGLTLKHLSQVQIAQVLMTLFRYIDLYNNTSIKLKLSSYMNQVIIVLDVTDNIAISGLKRQITNQISNKLLSIQKKKQTLYLSLSD